MQLHEVYDRLQKLDTEVVVIGPDGADAFREYWKEHGFLFHGIPDMKHSVLKLYGQEVKLFKLGRMPAQMLVDKAGVLRFVHYGHSMADIPSVEEVFELIELL